MNSDGEFSPYRYDLGRSGAFGSGSLSRSLVSAREGNHLGGIPHRDTVGLRFHAGGHAIWDLPGRGRDRHREAEAKASVSRRSLPCNRAEGPIAMTDELALVRPRANG